MFEGSFVDLVPAYDYTVTPDAQRIIMFQGLGNSDITDHVIMITNWFADLEQTFANKPE